MNEIKLTINSKEVSGTKGESILNCAERHGISIPTLCHDPRLEPYSSCFVCVVEVKGMRGLQTSCSTRIAEGMVVETENERIAKARKMALDLLLSNHYADCAAPCKQACPAGVDVQGYISLIDKGLYNQAVALIKQVNPLPAICGRVCVRPCEVACRRNLLDEGAAVGIDYLKRFAADFDLKNPAAKPIVAEKTGKKVAVIGAGPGGLSCAWFLQQKGHQVDIYEANPNPGGMLRYGIPEYRLPNNILDGEVKRITDLGTNIFYNQRLGKNLSYSDLQTNYDSVILTIGSQSGTSVGCEGDDAQNVFSGIDFLRNMEITGQKLNFTGKTVAVVGGGNTAMDCCRTAMRCGAEKVYIIYRRTEKEMPANPIEIHESKLEGIEYLFLTNPSKINKDENGVLKSMTCIKMELGEPDKSGRRRPEPVQGSEFDIPLDYVLAAIGQKTVVDFIDDINNNSKQGKLQISRWGDIDADPKTLQTGIKSMFAAGDGVTGPATLIEAIAQAKKATNSCHQYLSGEKIEPLPNEFLSKKENFKEQIKDDYVGRFARALRNEMPVLDADKRFNFNEVELGYANQNIAKTETQRCLECGCVEYFDCDLKKYSTKYGVEQKKFEGNFNEFKVDFSHPYIEIDNNKCILCSRCIRICREVVGANALGLVNRGFDTFVAPSMKQSLTETNCESCGLCISTCPTGAITENVKFKPGPVKLDSFETISNYGSSGERITINHKNGFVMKVTGAAGLINPEGNFSRQDKFGYSYFNDKSRITKPLLKQNGIFKEISFEEAYLIISNKIKDGNPDQKMFFAGARLTNEEQYLVQKLARAGAKTNNVGSFHYLGRGNGHAYQNNSNLNIPFDDLNGVKKIFLIGAELNIDNPIVGFIVNNLRTKNNTQVDLITENPDSSMKYKIDNMTIIQSYYHFIKAVNYYIVSNKLYNELYINHHCADFDAYKDALLKENFDSLVKQSGVCCSGTIINFATEYNKEPNAALIFSEKEVASNTCSEIQNLALLTGKLGKTSNGIVSLKEKNNSHGLLDMGACPKMGVGYQSVLDNNFIEQLQTIWKTENLSQNINLKLKDYLLEGKIKQVYIFGEDPIGCAIDKNLWKKTLTDVEFLVVSDYFITETAQEAHLILPASFPTETGGSFTNTQKVIQNFDAALPPRLENQSFEQLIKIQEKLGIKTLADLNDVTMEIVALLPKNNSNNKLKFHITEGRNWAKMFDYGCDYLEKRFAQEFSDAFGD